MISNMCALTSIQHIELGTMKIESAKSTICTAI
jgi:hypothetical protein